MKQLFLIAVLAVVPSAASAQPAPTPEVVAPSADLAALTLVRSSSGRAVVRAAGALHVLAVGDRVGRTAARVAEIASGRLVLEEATTGAGGAPVRARIVLRDGETGGRRFTRSPGATPPPAVRPEVLEAPAQGRPPKPGSAR